MDILLLSKVTGILYWKNTCAAVKSGSHRNRFQRSAEILPFPLCLHALVPSSSVRSCCLFIIPQFYFNAFIYSFNIYFRLHFISISFFLCYMSSCGLSTCFNTNMNDVDIDAEDNTGACEAPLPASQFLLI